jgi:hypothetical protein
MLLRGFFLLCQCHAAGPNKRLRILLVNQTRVPDSLSTSQFLLWSRFCKEDHHHLIKLFSSSITEYLQIRTGNCLDAMRWTMNYYHNVIDSVHYSYHYWKKSYFVPVSSYPIQNNPAQVIHLCLLGCAIKTCSKFFRKLGVKASWQNTGWNTALKTLSSNSTGLIKVAPNVDTYLTISHSYRMQLGSTSAKQREKEVLEGHLRHIGHSGFKSRTRKSSGHSVINDHMKGGRSTADPRIWGDEARDETHIIGLQGIRALSLALPFPWTHFVLCAS